MTPLEGQPQVAAENGGGANDGQRRRPDPLRWIWYAFGGALGPRYRQWVLRDLTCRTRWERQIARAVVQVMPLAFGAVPRAGIRVGYLGRCGLRAGVGADLLDRLLRLIGRLPPGQARPSIRHRPADPQ